MSDSSTNSPETNQTILKSPLFVFTLLVVVGFSRYLPLEHSGLFNFSPTLAIFFIAGAFLRGAWAWAAPLCAIFVSDLFLNASYGINWLEPFMLVTILSYLLVFGLGKWIGPSHKIGILAGGALGSALLFYLLTCTFSWMTNPVYIKSVSGLIQALTLGEPGYAPAYLFLRNSLCSTLLFTLFFRWAIYLQPHSDLKENIRSVTT
jgi:hypothetical protein